MRQSYKRKSFLSVLAACIVCLSLAGPAWADKPDDGPKSRELIVELRDGGPIDRINARYGTTTVNRMPGTSTYLLSPPAGISAEQAAAILAGDTDILFAESNRVFKDLEAQQFSLAFDGQYSLAVGDDQSQAMYRGQWAVYRTHLSEAHTVTTGQGATVAIVDTGVALSHPALEGKFTVARYDFVDDDDDPSDLPNGIDDDGDGFADEAAGHGTFLAGIVALVAPEAHLMPLRVLDSEGWGLVYNVAAAIRYAVDHGAKVVNVSLGASRSDRVIQRAVDYAHAKNVVVVASVGNRSPLDRTSSILYPARYDTVVAVAATDSDDMKASFSNWGKETDLSAPGATIYSTYWNGGYAWWSGTSMAAAFVSGGAALVAGLHANWTKDNIVSRLAGSAVNIDSLNYPQYRGRLGNGRIDFYSAVK